MYDPMSLEIGLGINSDIAPYTPGVDFVNSYEFGMRELPEDTRMSIQKEFCRYLAKCMRRLLKNRIREQYKYWNFEPLSKGYEEYKKRVGLKPGFWQATGFLCDHISYRRVHDHYEVGIDPNLKYPDGGPSVLFIARCLELGTKYIPSRKLFEPTTNFMRRHIRQYWLRFLGTEYLKKIVVNSLTESEIDNLDNEDVFKLENLSDESKQALINRIPALRDVFE